MAITEFFSFKENRGGSGICFVELTWNAPIAASSPTNFLHLTHLSIAASSPANTPVY